MCVRTWAAATRGDAMDRRFRHRHRSWRECRPNRPQRDPPVQEPPLASHLVTPLGLYSHHGIYVGNGRVIHYAGLAHGLRRGRVGDVPLESFAHGIASAFDVTCTGSTLPRWWSGRAHSWENIA